MTDITPAQQNIQQEEVDYRSSINESTLTKIGASINFINKSGISQIGDVMFSYLTEAQFQSLRNTTWVLCNGQSVVGSDYETFTGNSSVPNASGRFPRVKDNGASVDPQGDSSLGSTRTDIFKSHVHQEQYPSTVSDQKVANPAQLSSDLTIEGSGPLTYSMGASSFYHNPSGTLSPLNTVATGSSETAPKTIVMNQFIKINQ